MDDLERAKRFGDYLTNAQLAISNKRHRMISGSQIAREAGVSQPSFNQWMTGTRLPDPSNRIRICLYLWKELHEVKAFEILEIPSPDQNDGMLLSLLAMLQNAAPEITQQVVDYTQTLLK